MYAVLTDTLDLYPGTTVKAPGFQTHEEAREFIHQRGLNPLHSFIIDITEEVQEDTPPLYWCDCCDHWVEKLDGFCTRCDEHHRGR